MAAKKPQSTVSRFRIEGADYTFDFARLMISEARFLQRTTDLSVKQWSAGLEEMNADCVAALYVLLRHRADPESVDLKTADLDDFDFDLGSFENVQGAADPTNAEGPDSSASGPLAVA